MKQFLLILGLFVETCISCFAQSLQLFTLNNSSSSNPHSFTPYADGLFFYAYDGINWYELFKYDVNGQLTKLRDVLPGVGSGLSSSLSSGVTVGNKMYLGMNTQSQGYELVQYDGNSFSIAADVDPLTSSNVRAITAFNNKIYFSAQVGSAHELYSIDPANNNALQKLSNLGSTHPIDEIGVFKGKVYFSTFEPTYGGELYCYNPATQTTTRVYDINPGTSSSWPGSFQELNNMLYFKATSDSFSVELYRYDGFTDPVRITDLGPGPMIGVSPNPLMLKAYKGKIIFSGIPGLPSTIESLFSYDPSNNTVTKIDVFTPNVAHTPRLFTIYNGKLFFVADDSVFGRQLCVYDGITAGLAPGIAPGALAGSQPNSMAAWNNSLYMSARVTAVNWQLYKYTDAQLDIRSVDFDVDITTYPNPVSTDAQIEIIPGHAQKLNLIITDATGKQMYETGMKLYDGKTKVTIPMQFMAAGVYFYSVRNVDGIMCASGKLVKE